MRRHRAIAVIAAMGFLTAGCGDDDSGEAVREERRGDQSSAEATTTTGPPSTVPYRGQLAPPFSADELLTPPTDAWITFGGTVLNQRYSPLADVTVDNVANLQGAWTTSLGSGVGQRYSGEATPIVYDGVMFVVTGAHDVSALDATTGELFWRYEADLDDDIDTACCGWTSRGVALGDGMVFLGRLDGRLVALDQRTGEEVWTTAVGNWERGETLTAAPLYYDGMVITGIAGGEFGIRGRVQAYDASTGDELWRFDTIPDPDAIGGDTWPTDNDARERGGATVWQTPAVDPNLGLLYFSTSNAAPDYDGSSRPGDNLFAVSMVAVDAATGEYRWHFQQVHHDIWDYDAASPVVLFDIELDGATRQAIAQASKTGYVYILDRATGEPLIGIEETPVPQDERQHTAATQPIPIGDPFVPVDVSAEDIAADLPDFDGPYGGIFTPFWDERTVIKPSGLGGSNWPPASFSPDTGFLYVCGIDRYSGFVRNEDEFEEGERYTGSSQSPPDDAPIRGTFTAMDMRTNRIAWQKEWDDMCYSGSLATAGGVVFVGEGDDGIVAYDAADGTELWRFVTEAGVNAPPMTYAVDDTQYVAVFAAGNSLAGTTHGDTVWVFSLDGDIEQPVAEAEEENDDAPQHP